jgi:hypothetical protein
MIVRIYLNSDFHKRCQTVRTQFSEDDVAIFYWSTSMVWMYVEISFVAKEGENGIRAAAGGRRGIASMPKSVI